MHTTKNISITGTIDMIDTMDTLDRLDTLDTLVTTKNILITGTTGFLGRFFTKAILEHTNDTVYAPVRSKRGIEYYERKELASLLCNRFNVIEGDISDESIIKDCDSLPEINEFWHIAGLTDFHEEKRDQIMAINVDGTRNAINLAKRLNVSKFYYVSTAYVSGIHEGAVLEDELLPNPRFRNAYEESKYIAEKMVRDSGLPFIVIRPSIIMGHSVSGEVVGDKMAYGIAKVYTILKEILNRTYKSEGGIPKDLKYYVKGNPQVLKNLICVDDVVKLMCIIRKKGEVGKSYHCCNEIATFIGDMDTVARDVLGMDYITMTQEFYSNSSREQDMIDKGVKIYEDYMLISDPKFSLSNIKTISNGDGHVTRLDRDKLHTLVDLYINKKRDQKQGHTASQIDTSRLYDVRKYGSFSLAYETTSRQFETFKMEGVEGYIAYCIFDNTAIMVGNPVSNNQKVLIDAFIKHCTDNSLECCAVQCHLETAERFRARGYNVNKIGIETFIDLHRFDAGLKGKGYNDFRYNKNVVSRYNLNVCEKGITEVNHNEVLDISRRWISQRKNTAELKVLLREISLSPEPYVRYYFVEHEGKIIGFTFMNPIFKNGTVIGYYENIVRYDHGSLTGISSRSSSSSTMIVLQAAKKFKQEGAKFLSLGLSPLHDLSNSPYNDNMELKEFCESVYDKSELYAFKGIAKHKDQYPATIRADVFFAYSPSISIESIFNIFKAVGVFKD